MTHPRLLRWFAADAEAEGQNPLAPDGPYCRTCGSLLRDGSTRRACPICADGRRK